MLEEELLGRAERVQLAAVEQPMRVQTAFMTDTSCVTTTIVRPSSRLMRRRRPRTFSVMFGSSAEVASSLRRIDGSLTRARAIATRCFCPPLSSRGSARSLSSSPTSSSISLMRRSA